MNQEGVAFANVQKWLNNCRLNNCNSDGEKLKESSKQEDWIEEKLNKFCDWRCAQTHDAFFHALLLVENISLIFSIITYRFPVWESLGFLKPRCPPAPPLKPNFKFILTWLIKAPLAPVLSPVTLLLHLRGWTLLCWLLTQLPSQMVPHMEVSSLYYSKGKKSATLVHHVQLLC